ncbi:MAG: cation diffusion facilitator family transporter [Bacteroidales bacterium]|jgi:cobalt-zinc-cadmium efflux system protein|nr:cation diffusion facilitator family transporter [Bacteroidales bacterium]MDY0368440.1 cation diffusion facilitator family transporter [Bacteroidales bacterium]
MSHNHADHITDSHLLRHSRAFAVGIGLNIIFVLVEVTYGLLANSSALLADAGHNASDVLSLVFAWAAAWMATLKPKGKFTYGLRKTTILVSVLNALLLFGAVAMIAIDAIRKLKEPEPVAGPQVMIVAGIGILINGFTALLFAKGQKEDLNIKGAYLHMVADAAVSLGVVVAGLFITLTGKSWIDPLTSFIIIGVIIWGTWHLFVDSVSLALDAVPKHIKIDEIEAFLMEKEEIQGIHDLHVWAISTTQVALSAHLLVPELPVKNLLLELQQGLETKFGIRHTTFQFEDAKDEKYCLTKC